MYFRPLILDELANKNGLKNGDYPLELLEAVLRPSLA